jgi:hypothetical protein
MKLHIKSTSSGIESLLTLDLQQPNKLYQSLDSLKSEIEPHFGIPKDQQHLVYEAKELHSDSLQDFVLENSTVAVIFVFRQEEWASCFTIRCNKLNGEQFSLVVSPKETISSLKQKIHLIQGSCISEVFAPSITLQLGSNLNSSESINCFSSMGNSNNNSNSNQASSIKEESQTLSEAGINSDGQIVNIAASAPHKKAFHCAVDECYERIVKIIGDCMFCGARFCSRHRLPESHLCSNLNSCKQQSFEDNHSKLMKGKCVAGKLL